MSNTPRQRQQWILDLLKGEPNSSYGEMWRRYGVKWRKSENTFKKDWKHAQELLKDYQIKAQKEKERVSIEAETQAVKQGLKTKIDRLFTLQNQIEQIQKELDAGECEDVKFVKGEPKKIKRPLLPMEKSAMRRNIKELQAEISKMEGDYAPIKQDHTTQGDKIGERVITFVTIDKNGNKIVSSSD